MSDKIGYSDCWTYPKDVIDEKIKVSRRQYESYLEGIQEAGETAIESVEAKGEEVLETIPDDYSELVEDVSELKADFNNLNLSDISGLVVRGNQIPHAVAEYYKNTYWYISTNPTELKRGANTGYDAYKIRINDPTGIIYFKNSPFTFIIDASDNILAGTNNTYATSYDLSALTNPAYICFTNHKGIASDPYVSENLIITKQNNEIITDKNNVPLSISQSITPSSTSLYPGGNWGNSVMQNMLVSLNFDIDVFSYFTLGFVDQSNTAQVKLNVSDTTLTYVLPGGSSVSDSHGLTFTNNLQMVVLVNDTDKIKISLTSNGITYSKTWVFRNAGVWRPYARIPDQTTTAKLSMEFLNINKPVWAFGDSYFSYDTTRWIYYLSQDGYQNNCLIDAFSGRNSTQAYASLNNLLKLGIPKYVFWCMGMNDGSDSASAPSTTWKTNLDKVIATCKQYGITLILATIPTVPTVNNEQKNAFVRNSGYQYVDFAKAVGANSSGVWFSGMLSSDNVHPAVPGGIALYNRVLCDFPQITIK